MTRNLHTHPCRIPVGATAKMPTGEMVQLADATRPGWVAVYPQSFICEECGCDWEAGPFTDLETVSCSNCYSDRVLMTAIQIEMPPVESPTKRKEEQANA